MLRDAGWVEGKNWLNEVPVPGMPNRAGEGFADYVLYDDAHRPLAVIEAKKTCVDPARGRQQAQTLRRPSGKSNPAAARWSFLTNGFDTRLDDGTYPERRVAAFYSPPGPGKALQSAGHAHPRWTISRVDRNIAGRWYQGGRHQGHLPGSCPEHRRKALLVMATGFRQDPHRHRPSAMCCCAVAG